MNCIYLEEYTEKFGRILSIGYKLKISPFFIERSISYSKYFKAIEYDNFKIPPFPSDNELIKEIYVGINKDFDEIPNYRECYWAAESYLRIQGVTQLPFECIFLYIPLEKMYKYFNLYHEIDFVHIIEEFNRLYQQNSTIDILTKTYKYQLKEISEITNVSYNTLLSIKDRRRDIKKLNVEAVSKLAKIFNVQIETLAEIKI